MAIMLLVARIVIYYLQNKMEYKIDLDKIKSYANEYNEIDFIRICENCAKDNITLLSACLILKKQGYKILTDD